MDQGQEHRHSGSCHCGKVRFAVDLDLGKPVITCNCSICSRTGAMLAFVPAEKFTLEAGADDLTDYQFGKKRIHHTFCSTCGVRAFARGSKPDGTEMRAVNVRCLEGVDLGALQVKQVDGKSL